MRIMKMNALKKVVFFLLIIAIHMARSNPTDMATHSGINPNASQHLIGYIQVCFYQLPNTGSVARLLPLNYEVRVGAADGMASPRPNNNWGNVSIFGFFPPASPQCLPRQQFQANCTNQGCDLDNKFFEINVKGQGRENNYQIRMRCISGNCTRPEGGDRRIWLPKIGNPPFANNQIALCNTLMPLNPQGDRGCTMLGGQYNALPPNSQTGPERPFVMNNPLGTEADLYLMLPYY